MWSLLDRANKDATGHLWASLSDVLPLLAEAAPDVFLRAVQTGLKGADPLLRTLFQDQDDGFSASRPHAGLLWALEVVAWSSTHFGHATEQLARLAEVDPGGRLSNRPAESLVDIFRPWLPQTTANASSRLTALKALVSRHPDVGWNLLLALLPEHYASGNFTDTPRFRPWKPTRQGVVPHEFWEFSSAVAEQVVAITQARTFALDRDRLANGQLSTPPQRDQAYTQLQALSEQDLPGEVRVAMWEKLNDELQKHRAFPKRPAWVLPPCGSLRPSSTCLRVSSRSTRSTGTVGCLPVVFSTLALTGATLVMPTTRKLPVVGRRRSTTSWIKVG